MYTLELYKSDKRTAAGERLESTTDGYTAMSQWDLDALKRRLSTQYPSPKYRIELHETMVTKKNIMNGKNFEERYDTPYSCSPSSETYWSM